MARDGWLVPEAAKIAEPLLWQARRDGAQRPGEAVQRRIDRDEHKQES